MGSLLMRKFLLATTAAAVAFTFSGRAFAETDHTLFSLRKFVTGQAQTTGQAADQTAKPAATEPAPADLGAVGQQLKELVDTKLQHYVPREHDRAGVLAFYRDRNFAPLWT